MNPETLTAWRKSRHLSRRAAADVLGISQRTLENLEYGRYETSPLWGPIGKLIDALGPPPE